MRWTLDPLRKFVTAIDSGSFSLSGTATEVADYVDRENDHPLARLEVVKRKDLVKYRQLVMHAEDVQEATVSPRALALGQLLQHCRDGGRRPGMGHPACQRRDGRRL